MLVTQGGSTRKTRGSKRLISKMEEKKQKAIVGDINYNTLVGDSVCGSGLLIGGGMGLEAREVGRLDDDKQGDAIMGGFTTEKVRVGLCFESFLIIYNTISPLYFALIYFMY